MSASLKLIYHNLIKTTSLNKHRFLFHKFNVNDRLTGLIGPRGVGKTTLLLQYIKQNYLIDETFYFSADHIYFTTSTLYDFILDLYQFEGITLFFIDEIHKYKNWSQELKNLYDGFPDLKIVFSGSSSLDLVKGSYDLSRRAKLFHLPGMSFREYLSLSNIIDLDPIDPEILLSKPNTINNILGSIPKVNMHFQAYLKSGYYPFYYEQPLSYHEKLLRIVEKTIYEDIADYYNLKTQNLHALKKILMFLTSIKPGSVTTHNLAKNISVDDKSMLKFLTQLNETGLIRLIYPAEPGNAILRRPDKIFLNNTNLQYALEGNIKTNVEIGTIRELFFISMLQNAELDLFHSKIGDYQSQDTVFEIGGKSKTTKQIKGISNSFLVKDETTLATKREIPLWYFGFLY